MSNGKPPSLHAQNNQRANALNPNFGTTGTNHANAHHNGNRGKQLNPNQIKTGTATLPSQPASNNPKHG